MIRNKRLGWPAVIVAGAIAVGALVTLAVTGQLTPLTPDTSASISPQNVVTPPKGGSIPFASVWFDNAFTSSDSYPFAPPLK